MNGKYQLEIDNFIQRFGQYRDQRIVLYGIGRYTATLLDGLDGFHIVGLMDKDPANTGKVMQGVPIVDKDTAEETADMVIINTAETYWDVIYDRIKDIRVPVYYINGEPARVKEDRKTENPFKELSYAGLAARVERAEVISFDFFDTLFMRSVCSPKDVSAILERESGHSLMQMRDRAKRYIREDYSLDELYRQIEAAENMPHGQIMSIMDAEIALEKQLLVPRDQMLSLLRDLLDKNREVYIISDMYLPKRFYMDIFRRYGIRIPEEAILLSNELDVNKLAGTLWGYYAEHIVKGRSALHIGDDRRADVERPQEYGIDTYMAPNAWEMFTSSSLGSTASDICRIYDTCVMGCILTRLFNDPYVMHGTDGIVRIRDNFDMGYCAFAPVIMTFLLWLIDRVKADGVKKVVFMARDGYFLKQDLAYLCSLSGKDIDCCYIEISRQLAMMASIETKSDLMEYAQMPYTGTIAEMFEDRFGITGCVFAEDESIEKCIGSYMPQIKARVEAVRKDYLHYLKQFDLDDDCAVVDIGYYGNNQRYLNKLLDTNMAGYYFNANLSNVNKNKGMQKMAACFQNDRDVTGKNSQVLKRQIYLESFLTAPYGMVRAVDAKGGLVCADDRKNQEYFRDKEEINEGVKQFIADYIERFGREDVSMMPNPGFGDRYYGSCFGGRLEFSDEVKKSFYNDNAMMNRLESSLFN